MLLSAAALTAGCLGPKDGVSRAERTEKRRPGIADKGSNWLSAPDGPIYLVMRLYWPKAEPPSILPSVAGTWAPAGLKRVS